MKGAVNHNNRYEWFVYFTGTRNGRWVEAENMKSAKWIFALENGINSIIGVSATRKAI